MGKSKDVKNVNKRLDTQYDYDTAQRTKNNATYNTQIQDFKDKSVGSRGDYSTALGGLGDVAGSFMGGVGPIDTSALQGNAAAYKNFAQGNTPSGKFYSNLMNTGGYSEQDKADMSAEGNAATPAFFDNLRNMYSSQQAATGGYSPGYGASLARLSREGAREAQDAARRTSLGINESVRGGKERGAAGISGQFLGGMAGATQNDQATTQANLSRMGMDLQSKGIGAGLYGQQAQGYGNLYSSDNDNMMQSQAMQLKSQGMSGDAIMRTLQTQAERNPNKGPVNWGKVAAIAGAAIATAATGGAASPLLAGALMYKGGNGPAGPPPSGTGGQYG